MASGRRIGCDPASLPVAVQDSLSQAGLELVLRLIRLRKSP